MTKKHFVAIAKTIASYRENSGLLDEEEKRFKQRIVDSLVIRLANEFQNFNPLFDKEKFIEACK
jgi:hypothetical protein